MITREMVYGLSESLDSQHQGIQWPDPIKWDGRPLRKQAEGLLVLADAQLDGLIIPDSGVEARIRSAADLVRVETA